MQRRMEKTTNELIEKFPGIYQFCNDNLNKKRGLSL